jgi:hypothetical protein
MAFPIFKEVPGVRAVKALLRFFSYLFHLGLGLFLLAIAGLAVGTSPQSLHLDMLPWTGATLAYTVLIGALIGLLSVVLAITGKLRFLFFLWSLVVAVMLLKGYFFTGYRFAPGEVKTGLELLAAAWLALIGAWFALRQPAPDRYR